MFSTHSSEMRTKYIQEDLLRNPYTEMGDFEIQEFENYDDFVREWHSDALNEHAVSPTVVDSLLSSLTVDFWHCVV